MLLITDKGIKLLSKINLITKENLLSKSLAKMGAAKSSQLLDNLDELAALLSEDKKICKRISELAEKESSLPLSAGN